MIAPWRALFDTLYKSKSHAWRMPPYVVASDGRRAVVLDGDDASLPDCDAQIAPSIREWIAFEPQHVADRAALLAWCGDCSLVECEKCKGAGRVSCECGGAKRSKCDRCRGSGQCQCGCGDEHDCGECDGEGYHPCDCEDGGDPCYTCRGTGKTEPTKPGRVHGLVISRALLGQMLALVAAPEIRIGVNDDMLNIYWPGGTAIQMRFLHDGDMPEWPEVPR